MKCDMCDCHTSKIVKIRNHKNGNELNICRGCAVQNGFIKSRQIPTGNVSIAIAQEGFRMRTNRISWYAPGVEPSGKIVRCWLMMNINYFRMEAEG